MTSKNVTADTEQQVKNGVTWHKHFLKHVHNVEFLSSLYTLAETLRHHFKTVARAQYDKLVMEINATN